MKKLILLIAMFFCLAGVAGAWDDGGWDNLRVPYIKKTAAPAVTDDGFKVPYLWVDETNDKFYLLIDNTPGAAVWEEVAAGTIPTLVLADTTTSSTGVIYKGADRFIHNFHHPTGGGFLPDGLNTFIGIGAGNFTMGATAATSTDESSNNTGIGKGALGALTLGYKNMAVGSGAGAGTTEGSHNVFMGSNAGVNNTTGDGNVAVGEAAGVTSVVEDDNTYIGYVAGGGILGSENVCIGSGAGEGDWFSSDVSGNVFIGLAAGGSVETGADNNVFIGYKAGNATTTGASNILIGANIDAPGATDSSKLNIGNLLKGDLSSPKLNVVGSLIRSYTITTDNTDGVGTHTIAELLGGLIRRGTGDEITAARIDVTDTAANIVAGIPACAVGSGFEFSLSNEDSTHTIQLDGGAGVTIAPNDPSTAIPANSTGRFLLVVTNATAASEAVTVHALGFTTH